LEQSIKLILTQCHDQVLVNHPHKISDNGYIILLTYFGSGHRVHFNTQLFEPSQTRN